MKYYSCITTYLLRLYKDEGQNLKKKAETIQQTIKKQDKTQWEREFITDSIKVICGRKRKPKFLFSSLLHLHL